MFSIDTTAQAISDSDSDCELPKFDIPAFKKYGTTHSHKPSQPKHADFHNKSIKLSSCLNAGENYDKWNYVNANPEVESSKSQVTHQKEIKKTLEEKLKKSIVCQPGFEKLDKVPTFLSRRQKTKLGLKERDKTKGYNWFNMPAPEMTEEKKNDLSVIQLRQALDPKQFYKRSAVKSNPKYFQVGTFVESPVEFYSSRIPKKQRKQTLVEELLADGDFRQYQKKKFAQIQQSQPPKFVRRKKVKGNKVTEARVNASRKQKNKKRS